MEIGEAIVIPVILGIVEIAKQFGLPSKYATLVSLLLGVGITILMVDFTKDSVLMGIVFGLSSSGLYSGSKKILEKKQ